MLASLELHEALQARGYAVVARHSVRRKSTNLHITSYHCVKDGQTPDLLLVVIDDNAGNEGYCKLFAPLTQTNSVADTIAAIP